MPSRRDPLHQALIDKTGFSQQYVSNLILKREAEQVLSRRLAIVSLALENKVRTRGLVADQELAELRAIQRGTPRTAAAVAAAAPAPAAPRTMPRRSAATRAAAKSRQPHEADSGMERVMVAYGRDDTNTDAMFTLLRAMRLDPIEWTEAMAESGKGTPSIRETVEAAFRVAKAVVVMITPDDIVLLRPSLRKTKDPGHEKRLIGQARPNVLFEAGMAFGLHPDKTVVVSVGTVKPLTDLSGLHITPLDNRARTRQEFATKLRTAGCHPRTEDRTQWLHVGQFVLRDAVEIKLKEGANGRTTTT